MTTNVTVEEIVEVITQEGAALTEDQYNQLMDVAEELVDSEQYAEASALYAALSADLQSAICADLARVSALMQDQEK